MSLSISLHPLSKTLHLHGSPDASCAYSLSGSVNITIKPPTPDTRTDNRAPYTNSLKRLAASREEDNEMWQPLLDNSRSGWESAHGSRTRTSDPSASSSSLRCSSSSTSTPLLGNQSSYSNSAFRPAPSTFKSNATTDYPICSTSSHRSPNIRSLFDSNGSSATKASKTTAISKINDIDMSDSEPGLFYNVSTKGSMSHDLTPVNVVKETRILLTSLVVTFEGKAEHQRVGRTIKSVRLCQVSQELIDKPIELSHQPVYCDNDMSGDDANDDVGAGTGNETTYGLIFDLLTIPGWIPATLRATDSNNDTNDTHRSHITKYSQQSASLTSYSLFATATYQVLYPETQLTWSDTFDAIGFGEIGKLFQACVPMTVSESLAATSSRHDGNNSTVQANPIDIEVVRCISPPHRSCSPRTLTSNGNDAPKSLFPPTIYRISSHTKEGESPIPNDVVSKFEVVASAPRFVGMDESRIPITLKLRCDLGERTTSTTVSGELVDTGTADLNEVSQPFATNPIVDGTLAIQRIEIDLDQDEEYSTEVPEEYKSHFSLPPEQPPAFPLLHSTYPSTTTGNNSDSDAASIQRRQSQTSWPLGNLFCNWFTGIERWVDRSVQAQNWGCMNSDDSGLCAEFGFCVCEQQQQQRQEGVGGGMEMKESTNWTKMRNLLDLDAPSCFLLDPSMREGTTRDLSKEEEEERTKDGKVHMLGDSWSIINFDAVLARQRAILPTCSSPFVNISHTIMVSIHVVYDGDKRDIVRFSLPIQFVVVPPTLAPTNYPTSIPSAPEPSTAMTQQRPLANTSPSPLCLPAYNQLFEADGQVKLDCSKGALPLYSVMDTDSGSGSGSKSEVDGEKSEVGRKVMRPDLVPIGTEWIDWEEAKQAGWV